MLWLCKNCGKLNPKEVTFFEKCTFCEADVEPCKSLLDSFEQELFQLIEKYSSMEITNAEAIGVLEIAKSRIIK